MVVVDKVGTGGTVVGGEVGAGVVTTRLMGTRLVREPEVLNQKLSELSASITNPNKLVDHPD